MNEEDRVKLKPLLGIHPCKYLTMLYSLVILILIFLIFFLAGIVRPGTLYSFVTVPSNAAVYIDGKYAGAAPCEVFVAEGEHHFRIEKDYYSGFEQTVNSGNRLFASLFFPKKETLNIEMPLEDAESLLEHSFLEFAGWGMIDTFYENYKPRPVLGPLFHDLYRSGFADKSTLSAFLYSVMPFVHNMELYEDLFEAVVWFERIKGNDDAGEGLSLSEGFAKLVFFTDAVSYYENLPFWYYSLLDDQAREDRQSWYPALQEEYGAYLRDFSNDYPSPQAAVTVNGMRFIMLSGGQFLMGADGNSFPFPASVDDFMIMDREVTNELYSMFMIDNSNWMPENTARLIDEGLVSGDYLRDFKDSQGSEPVNDVSWFAANAFCDWLESKLPDYLSGYTVRLPDELEWEWAVLTDSGSGGIFKENGTDGPLPVVGRYSNNSGLYDLRGNLWEWCGNWYAPASFLVTTRDPGANEAYIGNYPGVEKGVRGGSWANEKSLSLSVRGSQPPHWCTDFLGFRPVLVKE